MKTLIFLLLLAGVVAGQEIPPTNTNKWWDRPVVLSRGDGSLIPPGSIKGWWGVEPQQPPWVNLQSRIDSLEKRIEELELTAPAYARRTVHGDTIDFYDHYGDYQWSRRVIKLKRKP